MQTLYKERVAIIVSYLKGTKKGGLCKAVQPTTARCADGFENIKKYGVRHGVLYGLLLLCVYVCVICICIWSASAQKLYNSLVSGLIKRPVNPIITFSPLLFELHGKSADCFKALFYRKCHYHCRKSAKFYSTTAIYSQKQYVFIRKILFLP